MALKRHCRQPHRHVAIALGSAADRPSDLSRFARTGNSKPATKKRTSMIKISEFNYLALNQTKPNQ